MPVYELCYLFMLIRIVIIYPIILEHPVRGTTLGRVKPSTAMLSVKLAMPSVDMAPLIFIQALHHSLVYRRTHNSLWEDNVFIPSLNLITEILQEREPRSNKMY